MRISSHQLSSSPSPCPSPLPKGRGWLISRVKMFLIQSLAPNPRIVAADVRRRKRLLLHGVRLVTSAATARRFTASGIRLTHRFTDDLR